MVSSINICSPLIEKLTIREMIFFTIFHNLRHASREGD
jgi:hypothetical protein